MPNTTMMTLLAHGSLNCVVRGVSGHEPSCTISAGDAELSIHFDNPDLLIDWCKRAIDGAEKLQARANPVHIPALHDQTDPPVAEPAYEPTLGNLAEKQSKLLIREFAPGITIVDVLPADDILDPRD